MIDDNPTDALGLTAEPVGGFLLRPCVEDRCRY
jgi:L-serine deaminase